MTNICFFKIEIIKFKIRIQENKNIQRWQIMNICEMQAGESQMPDTGTALSDHQN